MIATDWAIVDSNGPLTPEALRGLTTDGVRVRSFSRRARPSPLKGRPDLESDLFPGHVWVQEDAIPGCLAALGGNGHARVLMHEKGRPLCLPQRVVDQLDAYCRVLDGSEVPPHLAMLDLLDGRDRIWFVLQNGLSWPSGAGEASREETVLVN